MKTMKGYLFGFLSAVIIFGALTAFAVQTTTLHNVAVGGIKIVLDGKEFKCTDVNGKIVEPMIYNGTTYIPVRAVSSAFGKAVHWDGEEKIVYLGKMDGKLENPTLKLENIENIAEANYCLYEEKNLFDNKGNFYDSAMCYNSFSDRNANICCETLLGKKYSKFKATLFVPKGSTWEEKHTIKIIGDGEVLLQDIEMDKTSDPLDIEISVTDVDNFKVIFDGCDGIYIANGGFYQ